MLHVPFPFQSRKRNRNLSAADAKYAIMYVKNIKFRNFYLIHISHELIQMNEIDLNWINEKINLHF